jgi:thioredoxin-related protein
LLPEISYGQLNTYQYEQLDSLQKVDKRTVAVFIHTDWCKCYKAMQNTSFKNKKVEVLLKQHFYFIDLNADEKMSIRFHGYTFHYRPTGNNTGVHELAEQLDTIGGKISFPCLRFL